MRKLPPNFHSYEHGGVAAPRFTLIAPALALLPLLRWPLGYATLSPVRATVRGLVLLILPPVFWFLWHMLTGGLPPIHEGPEYIIGYVAVTFGVTILRFAQRALGQHFGEEIHTAEAGYSFVTHMLPFVPAAFTEQLVMPGLIGWAGWEIGLSVSFDLGVWLLICAGSYFLVANWEQRNRMARRRSPVDDKIRAQAFADTIDQHEARVTKARRKETKHAPLYTASQPDIVELGRGKKRRRL